MDQLLAEADSYKLWTRYRWGLTMLAVSAAEFGLVVVAIREWGSSSNHLLVSGIPLLIGVVAIWWQTVKFRDAPPRRARRSSRR